MSRTSADSRDLKAPHVGRIGSVPYFQHLSPDALEAVALAVNASTYEADRLIFLQDEPAQGLYVVDGGVVRISRVSSEGRELILDLMHPGDTFNEVSILDAGPNPATATAHTDCVVLCLCRPDFMALGDAYPEIVWSLAANVAAHARRMIVSMADLALLTVKGRLAHLLLEEARAHDSEVIPRYVTQEEMAQRLGTVRETVGRSLKSLAAEGLIEIDRHRIVVLDGAGLAEQAEA